MFALSFPPNGLNFIFGFGFAGQREVNVPAAFRLRCCQMIQSAALFHLLQTLCTQNIQRIWRRTTPMTREICLIIHRCNSVLKIQLTTRDVVEPSRATNRWKTAHRHPQLGLDTRKLHRFFRTFLRQPEKRRHTLVKKTWSIAGWLEIYWFFDTFNGEIHTNLLLLQQLYKQRHPIQIFPPRS